MFVKNRYLILAVCLTTFWVVGSSLAASRMPLFCITGMAFESRNPDKDLFFVWTPQDSETGTLTAYRLSEDISLDWFKPIENQTVDLRWGEPFAHSQRMNEPRGNSTVILSDDSGKPTTTFELFVDERNLSGSLAIEPAQVGKTNHFAMHCAHVVLR